MQIYIDFKLFTIEAGKCCSIWRSRQMLTGILQQLDSLKCSTQQNRSDPTVDHGRSGTSDGVTG